MQISATSALQIVTAALVDARAKHFKPMAVVVVDASGHVLASVRENGASALRLDIAHGKAAAAIGMGCNSRTLASRAKDMPVFYGAIAAVADSKFIPQTGAVLITDATGVVVGAVGASGGTGDEDEMICIAGIAAVGLNHA